MPPTIHKLTEVGKGHYSDKKFLYVKLMDFKDEAEQELYYKKIQQLIKENSGRTKVF